MNTMSLNSADLDNAKLNEDAVNLYCLQASYPQIQGIEMNPDGSRWLFFQDGRRVLYQAREGTAFADPWNVDVRTSMQDVYALEPERPATPVGVAPGRRRSHDLLEALYGANPSVVSKKLQTAHILSRPLRLSAPAAQALARVDEAVRPQLAQNQALAMWLKSDGGFAWRRIAGETRLSPHAFGIALDLSAAHAAYWRWSKQQPHPQQQSYPSEIVHAFEDVGFIWGGKWHEYDIMHFEYRPELICKSRFLRDVRDNVPTPSLVWPSPPAEPTP